MAKRKRKNKYSWKEGSRKSGSAQKVGNYLEKIRKENGGNIDAEFVLKKAKPKSSPIHDYFEWDDTEAAIKWRMHEARRLVHAIVVVLEEDPNQEPVRAFWAVTDENKDNKVYTDIRTALSSEDLTKEILDTALGELIAFQKKYRHLKELRVVFRAIAEVRKK